MYDRMDRVAELIKREISVILREDINDPRVNDVTVTRVEVTRDLRLAKVYYVVSVDENEKKDIENRLKRVCSFIRGELAERISLKFTPCLSFREDKADERKKSIDSIFDRIETEQDENRSENTEGSYMDNENMKKVIEALKSRDNFLITAHVNPEGDSIGSQLAVRYVLEKLGKRSVMVDHDGVPDNLRFLPGTELIACEVPEDFHPDTAIVLDCAIKERTGNIGICLDQTQYIINIDHHVSNEFFGDVNWVEPKASSVGEMMYHIIKDLGMEIEAEPAQAMYAAIVTDTGMFTYDNTSKQTHEIAGELITKGVKPNALHREIFEKKSVSDVRLLGRVLATLKVEENGLLAHMSLTRRMYAEEGVEHVSTDEFINFPRSIKGVEVAVFFKQTYNAPENINVSFRSGGKVNVNTVASRFGGGGHERASGCTLTGTFEEVREKVLAEVGKALKEGADNLES